MKTAQLQQNSPNRPDWLLWVLVIILFIFLFIGFTGCNPINKATQQVLANQAAFNKVGATWAKLNPCVVDSSKTLVHDTTFKTDTTYKQLSPASAAQQINAGDVLKPPFRPARAGIDGGCGYDTVTQTITNTIIIHDSVKIVSVDKRALSLCTDSINYYKLAFANYKVNSTLQIASLQHKASTRLWLIICFIAALVMYIFRKPLLGLVTGGASLITKII